jgi:protein SCO1/2
MKNIFYFLLFTSLISCSDKKLPFFEPFQNEEETTIDKDLPFLGRETIDGKYKVPNFVGLTQSGDTLTQDDLKGKPYIAEFFYVSCPSICPLVKSQLLKMYNKKEFVNLAFVSFTLAPNQDTPKVLRKYATDLEVDTKRWTFVNVNFDEIYDLANGYLIAAVSERNEDGEIPHDGRIVLVDEEGHLRATCRATDKEQIALFKKQVINYIEQKK